MTKNCIICNKPITSKIKHQKLCGASSCKKKHLNDKARTRARKKNNSFRKKICVQCGKSFVDLKRDKSGHSDIVVGLGLALLCAKEVSEPSLYII